MRLQTAGPTLSASNLLFVEQEVATRDRDHSYIDWVGWRRHCPSNGWGTKSPAVRATIRDETARLIPFNRKHLLRQEWLRAAGTLDHTDQDTADFHASPLDEALVEYFRRCDEGERISVEAFCAEHPEVAEGLRDYFSQERGLAGVDCQTADYRPNQPQPAGMLRVRCPHCQAPQRVGVDSSLVDLTCDACDSTYNLAGDTGQTSRAATVSTIGHFELVERLGVGGFGSVWKARDTKLDRTVAVKIPRRADIDAAEIDKFLREARAAAQLRHPGIVAVHEVGRDGDTVYIVSDLVHGVSLDDWLTAQRPTIREAAVLAELVADALEHAHHHGVVHRDLKPGNILVDLEGAPHLVDFGLARREAGEVTMTVEGQILGTPAYMSPEQAQGDSHLADRRSDVYSLGVVLFELLTGELPFRGNIRMLLHQIVRDDPPSPRTFNSRIPKDLETMTLKCLEKEPSKRYASAGEVGQDLRRYLAGKPIQARPVSRVERTIRWGKRNPTMATAAALVLFLAIAGPVVAIRLAQLQWSLRERLNETASLIEQRTNLMQRSAQRTKELEEELAVWKGESNPWDFWPPRKGESLRRDITNQFYTHVVKYDFVSGKKRDRILVLLSKAMLAESLGRQGQAADHYAAACQLLEALQTELGSGRQLTYVLSECHLKASQLLSDTDRDAALAHLQQSSLALAGVASEETEDARLRVAWLESEWATTRLAGFRGSRERLERVASLKSLLPETWPERPKEMYQLACYLTGAEASLLKVTPPAKPPSGLSD